MQVSRVFVDISKYSWSERQDAKRRGKSFFVLIRGTFGNTELVGIVALCDLLGARHFTAFSGFVVPVILFAGYLGAFSDWDKLDRLFSEEIEKQPDH